MKISGGEQMPIVSSETIFGKTLEMLGIVKRSTIQAVNAFKDIFRSSKSARSDYPCQRR